MKKFLFFSLVFIVTLCACTRKAFINKLTGTWKISKYIFAKQDLTQTFKDTTNVNYQITFDEDQRYNISWVGYAFKGDTTINYIPTGDTVNNIPVYDTVRTARVDTTITPYNQNGAWVLLNSQEDIQLTNDSDQNNPVQYQILTLQKSSLNLLKGNTELDLTK